MLYYVYNNDIGMDYIDVSSPPLGWSYWNQLSFDGGVTWETLANIKTAYEKFRAPFSIRTTSSTANGQHWFGHSRGSNWPTVAGRKYLFVCDVRNAGAQMKNTYLEMSGVYPNGGPNISYSAAPTAANQTTYSRVYRTFGPAADSIDDGRVWIAGYPVESGKLVQFDIKNWRQFDVTDLTNAQITALATKENYDEVYLELPTTFKGQTNMTPEKFLAMGGIIRNSDVDLTLALHEVPLNYTILS